MADVEIVIKIPEEKYDVIKSDLYNTFPAEMKEWGLEAIRNGTPLHKGHGDLIDKKVAYKKFYLRCLAKVATEVFAEIPTIIESDREEQK